MTTDSREGGWPNKEGAPALTGTVVPWGTGPIWRGPSWFPLGLVCLSCWRCHNTGPVATMQRDQNDDRTRVLNEFERQKDLIPNIIQLEPPEQWKIGTQASNLVACVCVSGK